MMQKSKEINSQQNKEEDFAIVQKVLEGDKHSFQILQKKYRRIIFSLIRKMIHNEDDVEDLTQETFIKAYNALSKFQAGFSFSSWLYKIASNTCIDFLRKRRFATVSLSQPISQSDDEHFLEIEDKSYMADINVVTEERRKALFDAIDSLPENYRAIIKLRHEEDLDYVQISEKLDMPLGTVKAHLFRARKILMDSLKKDRYLFNEH